MNSWVIAMPNKPYVSLQDRFSKEEEYTRWGVPMKKKSPGTTDKIQEALQEGWIQPEDADQPGQQPQQPQQPQQQPMLQGVAAVKAKAQRKLRKFFHEKSE